MINRFTFFLGNLFILSLLSFSVFSQSQTKTASTITQSGSGSSWSNLSKLTIKDSDPTEAVLSARNSTTKSINCSDFGFNIPSGAVINGVSLTITKRSTGLGLGEDDHVQLLNTGIAVGDDKATIALWPFSYTDYTYGSSSDNWGLSLSPAMINDNDFGATFSVKIYSLWTTVQIDYIEMTVTYGYLLPVELVNFSLLRSSITNTELKWTTASEIENEGFEILRSTNCQDWETIATVLGHGTSNIAHNYSYIDSNVYCSIVYYRLKQIDFDGSFEYSKTLTSTYVEKQFSQKIRPYPNPTINNLYFDNLDGSFTITIWDNSGKLKLKQNAESSQAINVQTLRSGLYYVQIETPSQVFKSTFVKK